jgi:hypothetical protein
VLSKSAVAVAFAQEMLRLRPAVKFLFRRAMADVTIGDVAIPAGTQVAVSVRQVRRARLRTPVATAWRAPVGAPVVTLCCAGDKGVWQRRRRVPARAVAECGHEACDDEQ